MQTETKKQKKPKKIAEEVIEIDGTKARINLPGRPLTYRTPQELWNAAEKVFDDAEANGLIPTRLYVENTLRTNLADYKHRDEFSSTVIRIERKSRQIFEQKALRGEIVPKIAAMYLIRNLSEDYSPEEVKITGEAALHVQTINKMITDAMALPEPQKETLITQLEEIEKS